MFTRGLREVVNAIGQVNTLLELIALLKYEAIFESEVPLYAQIRKALFIDRRVKILTFRIDLLKEAMLSVELENKWRHESRLYYVLIFALILNCFCIFIKNLRA